MARKTLKCINILALMLFLLVFTACNQSPKPASKPAKFAEYVSAYTAGVISKESTIRVVLVKPTNKYPVANEPAAKGILSFEPEIDGDAVWENQNTLLFTPKAELPEAISYQGLLNLSAIYTDVPEHLNTFTFNFQIIDQVFEVNSLNLRTYSNDDLRVNKIEGEIISNDIADRLDLDDLLIAKQNGKALPITWSMNGEQKRYTFTIDSVQRGDEQSEVTFNWGDDVGDLSREPNLQIPALGDFSIIGVSVTQSPEQEITINFSDPLDELQNLKGLVDVERTRLSSFQIDDTELRIMINGTVSGKRKLNIYPGIKNAAGFAMKNAYESILQFADLKPAVALIGDGNIIPSTGNLALPFKAVNLNAVDVFVLKIYADNVAQFLQTNNIEGNYQLKRVGRPIAYKKIELVGAATDLKSWNNFSIDLASIINPEPGAIYRIEIKFRPQYSLYNCPDNEKLDNLAQIEDTEINTAEYDSPNNYYWDNYYDYDDWYYYDYDYRQRDNPCNAAYYTDRKAAKRNILATNLAITVKGGDKNEFTAFVTDITTAQPVSGASVSLLNYQQQVMKKGTTSADGSVTIKLDGKPFLALAEQGKQSAYLRIDDGSSLSLSNFEVAGSRVKQGLKGFIYAERGVWRPGDSIFTTFMLEDAENNLPASHPVIFEVRNPSGKIVERQVKSTHVDGIYTFPFATAKNAETGFYNCQVRVGSNRFSKSLRIEAIKPNRLKVLLGFEDSVLTGSRVNAGLHANWLTGATARNLKADVNLQMRNKQQPFQKFAAYDFKDETRRFYTSDKEVYKGQLDANGDANTYLDLGSYNQAPGMLEAVFVTRVFEEGGDFSINRQALPYSPFSHFVGLKMQRKQGAPWLTTDEPLTVDLITTTLDGELADRKVTAQVYSIDWSWWWSSGRNGMANYLNSSYARVIETSTVETKNGRGSFNFQVNYPNYGNYLVRVCDEESGHCASQVIYVDWPMGRNRNSRSNPGAPTMLTFTADKEKYAVGDEAHITIPTSGTGRLLVSIENGTEVIEHLWLDAEKGQTTFDLEIKPNMAPNVYAFVSYIQPHSHTANDLPIRLYGVIPIMVNDATTELNPVIKTAKEWKPESKAEITVSEKNGKAMTYTIAVVDEGLLDITNFKTPNPWKHFYAKEALGMRTWDFFDDVMGAFGGVIEKNFAIGGDDEIDPAGKKRLNRFKPLVKVFGPFKLAGGASNKHPFLLPNYIGSARVMVVARHEEAYGNAEIAVPVRKPLMVLATLPRVLGVGEKVKLPVQVFAMKPNIKNVSVEVKGGKLFSVSNNKQTLNFTEPGDQMAYFELDVQNAEGKGTIDVLVSSGKEKASYNIEVDVRNVNTVETRKQSVIISPGETYTFSNEAFGMPGSNKLNIDASLIPELNVTDALNYLLRYPHGCIEQTVSSAFPQLYVDALMSLTNNKKAEVKTNIMYALNKLQANQLPGGSFSTWPRSSRVNSWSTVYAGHFMLEAEKKGYTIPGNTKQRWLTYEKKAASGWRYRSSRYWHVFEQSYRLFVLALAGEPDMGAMNRLRNIELTRSAAWRLAAAYAVLGQADVANQIINKSYTRPSTRHYDPTFGNEMRASAMRLETYQLLNNETKAFEQAIILAKQLNNKNLYTSQATAFALMNMSKFLEDKKGSILKFSYKAGAESAKINQANAFYTKALKSYSDEVQISNNGNEKVYVSLTQLGKPLPGKEQLVNQQVSISVSYKMLDGSALNPDQIPQGTDFKSIVTINSVADRYKLNDMALTQIFPSGWEISNLRLLGLEDNSGQSYAQYRDIRDDRVYTYFAIQPAKTQTYEVRLNAAYIGKYYLSGPKVEAMYYPEVVGHITGKWVNVLEAK